MDYPWNLYTVYLEGGGEMEVEGYSVDSIVDYCTTNKIAYDSIDLKEQYSHGT